MVRSLIVMVVLFSNLGPASARDGGNADISPDYSCTSAPTNPAQKPCLGRAKNFVAGDVLFVEGQIDSMIYDILRAEGLEKSIERIELNSPGGPMDVDFPYLIADIIRERGITTSVRAGAACGSSCIILYQAGYRRVAHPDGLFVLHGVQVGFAETDYLVGCLGYGPRGRRGNAAQCAQLKASWYAASLERTDRIFAYLEKHGASPRLYQDLKTQPQDEDWLDRSNIFGVKDWWLPASEAIGYGVVQGLEN